MSLEDTLAGWTTPSSDSEQEKQERTERMIRDAVAAHKPFMGCDLKIYAKGSYANNTNVRADSDVDVAVECAECFYWAESKPGLYQAGGTYKGPWTPAKLRAELLAALNAKFPGQVNSAGATALSIRSGSARVDADVVPSFSYRYYTAPTNYRAGTKIFTTTGKTIVNHPMQQLENGRAKNVRTSGYFKQGVRVLKRVENAMVSSNIHREVPSYLIECLAYNCPDPTFMAESWTNTVRGMLVHIWGALQGAEPEAESSRWREVSECFYLFHGAQKWTRADGRDFTKAAWNYLGYKA